MKIVYWIGIIVLISVILGSLFLIQNKSRMYRLGNLIDAWYARQHGIKHKDSKGAIEAYGHPRTFGSFILTQSVSDLGSLDENLRRKMSAWWWSYDYDSIRKLYPQFNNAIRKIFDQYYQKGPNLKPGTCVVHYRVGDFTSFKILDPGRVAAAAKTFSMIPKRFEIVGGGKTHVDGRKLQSRKDEIEAKSDELLDRLAKFLGKLFPEAEVVMVSGSSPDEDFYRMCVADFLLVGPGSFAIMASAINRNERRSPAVKNLNFVDKGKRPEETIYENWKSYRVD